MRLRLPHPAWLFLATLLLIVGGIAVSFGIRYRRVKQLAADLEGIGTVYEVAPTGPDWFEEWMEEHDQYGDELQWLRYDVAAVNLKGTAGDEARLSKLGKYPNVRWLSLTMTGTTDAGLAMLTSLSTLERLSLKDSSVSEPGLELLRSFSNLRELSVDGVPITGRGLKLLKTLPHLEVLTVSGPWITNAELEELAEFPALKVVNLHNVRITLEGADRLRARPRKIEVNWVSEWRPPAKPMP